MYDDEMVKFEFDAAPQVVRGEVAAEPLALLWLHAPLDMAWKHIESAFEQFVANPDATDLLFAAREQLQALQGLFVLLDDAVARLNVLEILNVLDLLEHKRIKADEACVEVVMLALLRLRVFVDLRRRDRPVTELALLDSFNRLRILSARDVVDARTYLEYVRLLEASPASVRTALLSAFQAKAKDLRLRLDKNLVAWLKRDPKAHLAVASVFHQALHLSPTREEALLWWSAWHLAHVMQFANVMHSSELKPLLGRINRFLKRRAEDKAQLLAAVDLLDVLDVIHKLTRLLVEHAIAVPSVVQMLDDIRWPKEIPSAQQVAEAESLLLVADGEVFVQAADQVQASLTPLQDRFDLALRVNDTAAITALAPDFEQLAAILSMLELSDASGLLAQAAQRLRSAEAEQVALRGEDFEDIASALMRVDIELARLRLNLADNSDDADSISTTLGDATNALIEQALADLLRAKEKLLNQDDQNNVQDVAGLLSGVGTSFAMLGLPVWYTVVDGLRNFIAHLPSYQGAFADVQDDVADVFASLEYGLENFRDFQRAPQAVLASGQRALALLQSGTLSSAQQGRADFGMPVELAAQPSPARDGSEGRAPHTRVAPVQVQSTQHAELSDSAQLLADLPQLVPDDVDAEILEIFVEEGREIADALIEQLAALNADPSDHEALVNLRRSFHTIKGSGRIVGATLVGEFGWAFEHMLNQALEGVIEVSASLLALLGEAQSQFDHLLNALEGKAGLSVEALDQAMQLAHAAAEGQAIEFAQPVATQVEHEVTLTENAVLAIQEAPVPRIDPQLYEIFRNEVVEYLDYLDAVLAQGESEGGLYVDSELLRVTHSLLGGSRTAQASHMMALVQHVEHLVRAADEAQRAIQGEALSVMGQTLQVVRTLVDELGGLSVNVPDTLSLEADLLKAVAAMQHAAVVPMLDVVQEEATLQAVEAVEAVEAFNPLHEPAFDIPAEQDAELLEIFMEEASEILEHLDESLAAWQKAPDARAHQQAIQRHLHTFKGGARMAGLMYMGELTHTLEDVFADIEAQTYPVTPAIQGLMQRVFDRLHGMVSQLHLRQPIPAEYVLMDQLADLRANRGVMPAMQAVPMIPPPAVVMPVVEEVVSLGDKEERDEAVVPSERAELVRLRADVLDQMVASAGETAIQHVRLSQKFVGLSQQLVELEQTLDRLRAQLRRVEIENEAQMLWRFQQETGLSTEDFDPLEFDRFTVQQELGRGVMESLADIDSIRSGLSADVRDAEMVLIQQGRVGQVLQDNLMKARLVRFSTVIPRLKRVVRQVATELGKHAELEVVGADVEIEGGLLNSLVPAFEHMLRNSLAHGIESPARREALGKPPIGKIKLQLSTDSGYLLANLQDDGAGINIEALRRKAKDGGYLTTQMAENDQAAMQLIFRSGVSTASSVSMVAGRGVGMDAVADSLRKVGGDIQVDSELDKGARFRINIPLTQAIARGIAVRASGQAFAFPYAVIESIVRAPQRELEMALETESPDFEYAGELYPLLDLSALLRLPNRSAALPDGMTPILILRIGSRRMALRVDALIGSQQLFIKTLGPFVARLPALAGASLLGDGSIVLVLDVAEIFRLAETVVQQTQAVHSLDAAFEAISARPLVLVVDDSVTIRKVTERILRRYDLDVATAKDGVDALSYLHEHRPSVVLSDIEMPRMDGFELLASIRNDATLHDLPVVMITSRTGTKHREKAESLGVNGYLGKPYSEAELMNTLSSWLPAEFVAGKGLKASQVETVL